MFKEIKKAVNHCIYSLLIVVDFIVCGAGGNGTLFL